MIHSPLKLPNFVLKYKKTPIPVYLSMIDDKEFLLSSFPDSEISDGRQFWSENESFVELAKAYFKNYWLQSFRFSLD
jgi:hypothetical protein